MMLSTVVRHLHLVMTPALFPKKDEDTLMKLIAANHPHAEELRTWHDAEHEIASFYDRYINEMHPCRDAHGENLYDFAIENLKLPHCAKP